MKSRISYLWPPLIALTVVFASGQGEISTPDVGLSLDKLAHFGVFGVLATSVIRLSAVRRRGRSGAGWAWAAVAAFGALDEFRQSFTPGRSVELADWIADALGAAAAIGLYQGWTAYRNFLETPLMGASSRKG